MDLEAYMHILIASFQRSKAHWQRNFQIPSSNSECPRCNADGSKLSQVAPSAILMTKAITSVNGHFHVSLPDAIQYLILPTPWFLVCAHNEHLIVVWLPLGGSANFKILVSATVNSHS